MIPVFSREQARAFDEAALASGASGATSGASSSTRAGMSSVVLMENAGRGAVDAIEAHWPSRPLAREHALVVAGLGVLQVPVPLHVCA